MRPVIYVTLAFAPVIALILWLYFRKHASRAFSNLLLVSFALGATGVLLVLFAQFLTSLQSWNYLTSLKRILFYTFITMGFSSELGKYLLYRFYIIPKEVIDKPIHGITFSVMTSLGFSTAGLILFLLDPFPATKPFPELLYAFVYVPANLIFSVVMGFFVGMAKFIKSHLVFSLTGLFGATFFHGVFNFCLLAYDYKLLSLFAFGSTVIVFILGIKAAYTRPEPLDRI